MHPNNRKILEGLFESRQIRIQTDELFKKMQQDAVFDGSIDPIRGDWVETQVD
jgi:hypothetical protein